MPVVGIQSIENLATNLYTYRIS